MIYIGVDPGERGGLAIVTTEGACYANSFLGLEEDETWELFAAMRDIEKDTIGGVVVEKVSGYVGNRNNSGARMFNFGVGYGAIRESIRWLGFREVTRYVAPVTWEKYFGLLSPRRSKGAPKLSPKEKNQRKQQHKSDLLAHAMKLYPKFGGFKRSKNLKLKLSICDAILIAHYAMETMEHN